MPSGGLILAKHLISSNTRLRRLSTKPFQILVFGTLQEVQISYETYLLSQYIYRDKSTWSSLWDRVKGYFSRRNLIFMKRSKHPVCRKWKLKRSHKNDGRKTKNKKKKRKKKYIDWGVKQTPLSTGTYGKGMAPTYLYEWWWKEASQRLGTRTTLAEAADAEMSSFAAMKKNAANNSLRFQVGKWNYSDLKWSARDTQGLLVENIIQNSPKNFKWAKSDFGPLDCETIIWWCS